MFKTCVGGVLVAFALWLSPSPKEPASSVDGGQVSVPCTGTQIPLICQSNGLGICSDVPLVFVFRPEEAGGRDSLYGTTTFVCDSRNCRHDIAARAAPDICDPN
jgi:hypothetical protein